jgi:acyl carrier protein
MKKVNQDKLREIFTVILELPDDQDLQKIRRLGMGKWDSLAHYSIMTAIENEFNITLDLSEMEDVGSYQAAELLLEEKGL